MEFIKQLEQLIANAKKSLGRPYTVGTVNEKNIEVQSIEKQLGDHLNEAILEEGEEEEILKIFGKLKEEALELLRQHSEKNNTSIKRKGVIMESLEVTDLSAISKLIPIFNGKKNELSNFITNLELINETMSTAKRNAFFTYVFKSRLDSKVQNMVKQDTIPTDITQLITALKKAYKPTGTSNNLLSKLTIMSQRGETVRSFAEKIQEIVAELNDIQIIEVGEADRSSIVRTNNVLAFNIFKNGLRDQQILSTINASRVSTLMEALTIAEESENCLNRGQVLYSTNNQQNQNKCYRCGRNHNRNRCPAKDVNCRKCDKTGHFAKVCRTGNNGNNANNNNNGRNNNNRNNNNRRNNGNNNNRNNNNGHGGNNHNNNNGNNRRYNVNQIQHQGNSQEPEILQQESPENIH